MPKVAALTHARKEPFFLDRWLRHYGALFGRENLFVVKDGDDWDIAGAEGVAVEAVNFPRGRKTNDEAFSAHQAGRIAELLSRYDVVVRTDVDEFLVADPLAGGWDKAIGDALSWGYAYSVGIDMVHHEDAEAPHDPARPILDQRRHGMVLHYYTKPHLIARPVRFASACHSIEGAEVRITPGVVMFHMALFDRPFMEARAEERGDREHRSRVLYMESRMRRFRQVKRNPVWPLDDSLARIRAEFSADATGMARTVPAFEENSPRNLPDGLLVGVPERFFGTV